MRIEAMIFDMDGTLADTIPAVVVALQDTFRTYGGNEFSPEEIMAMFGPTEEGVIRGRVDDADFEAAVRCYIDRYEALHGVEPMPGVVDLLHFLRERGIHTGVVTGKGPGTAEVTMRLMGLGPYIEAMATGSPNGAIKPAAIREMLATWGVDPAYAAYVGDMPYDMQAAAEAGVIPIGAGWAESATVSEADGLVFRSVTDLKKWLQSM